jgi:hypothetical protein
VDPPADGKGHPLKAASWSKEDWIRVRPDFDKIISFAPSAVGKATSKVWPEDKSLLSTHGSRPKSTDGVWAPDACRYCWGRALRIGSAPADASDEYYYGTGDGAHNPYRCMPLKRALCEGGEPQSEYAQHLQSCLRFPPPGGKGKGKPGAQ